MSYLHYLCLFGYSGVQHIFCCVFILFFFALRKKEGSKKLKLKVEMCTSLILSAA
jgi:hypothetical protein